MLGTARKSNVQKILENVAVSHASEELAKPRRPSCWELQALPAAGIL